MKIFVYLNNLLKVLILSAFVLVVSAYNSHSEIIKNIRITGNERITNETLLTFLPPLLNKEVTDSDINSITKNLYETNFFKDVTIKLEEDLLLINVVENPIIQNIIYKGVKSDSLLQFLIEGVNLKDRSSFIEIYAEQDISLINNNLKKRGYFFSTVELKKEDLGDNLVNLVFDINLGNKAKIKKITFIGDKIFKDKKLRSVILSEEYKFWKFISGKKFLNEDLVNFDKQLLRNFYKNNGYYNALISSSFAKLLDNNDEFELIYNVSAGEKIFFRDLNIELPINFDENNFNKLKKILEKLKDEPYSINAIEKITEQIDIIALDEAYETIGIDIVENFDSNYLDLTFIIKETEKSFVKRINIFGNNITRENVIRNQLEIDEGDFYNDILLNKSINNIKSLNYFKKVESEIITDDTNNDKIVNISLEEKPTGEIGAVAGAGTSGGTIGFFIKENNFLGKGLKISSDFTLNSESVKGSFFVNNPNFNDTDKSVYAGIEATETDRLKDFGYKSNRTGLSYGTDFEFFDDLNLGIGNKNYYQKIETDSSASALLQKQEGDYWDSYINLDFTYDKRNQKFKTTDGFRNFYSIELPVISETNTLSNTYDYRFFTQLYDNNVTSFSFFAKASNSISGDDIKLTERNFLPSSKLRGFESGKIGPIDGNDFVGGNYASSININSTLPQILEENQNIDFSIFLDAGNVWGVDYDSSINDSSKIRSAAGIGVDWLTPIGPLNFSLSQPISKADTDKTESFRFNIGTSF
jgi:outer membrane protein insertion porin family